MADSEEPGRGVLTWRRSTILRVIDEYAAVHGCSPSNREIALAAGLKSASSALHHLRELKAEGYLSYEEGSPRTVRLLQSGEAAAEEARRAGTASGENDPARVAWVSVAGQIAGGEPIPLWSLPVFVSRCPETWSGRKRACSSSRLSAIR